MDGIGYSDVWLASYSVASEIGEFCSSLAGSHSHRPVSGANISAPKVPRLMERHFSIVERVGVKRSGRASTRRQNRLSEGIIRRKIMGIYRRRYQVRETVVRLL